MQYRQGGLFSLTSTQRRFRDRSMDCGQHCLPGLIHACISLSYGRQNDPVAPEPYGCRHRVQAGVSRNCGAGYDRTPVFEFQHGLPPSLRRVVLLGHKYDVSEPCCYHGDLLNVSLPGTHTTNQIQKGRWDTCGLRHWEEIRRPIPRIRGLPATSIG